MDVLWERAAPTTRPLEAAPQAAANPNQPKKAPPMGRARKLTKLAQLPF
ncbi:MAG: hypothetical protein ACJ788_00570 [Ktedonobacteraceae bacterium]